MPPSDFMGSCMHAVNIHSYKQNKTFMHTKYKILSEAEPWLIYTTALERQVCVDR